MVFLSFKGRSVLYRFENILISFDNKAVLKKKKLNLKKR